MAPLFHPHVYPLCLRWNLRHRVAGVFLTHKQTKIYVVWVSWVCLSKADSLTVKEVLLYGIHFLQLYSSTASSSPVVQATMAASWMHFFFFKFSCSCDLYNRNQWRGRKHTKTSATQRERRENKLKHLTVIVVFYDKTDREKEQGH